MARLFSDFMDPLAAYHKADSAIQDIVNLLAAA
jgi:hypothetical protein